MKMVENTEEKGEIAYHDQFLLFPQCFPKDLYCRHIKLGFVWERVNDLEKKKNLSKKILWKKEIMLDAPIRSLFNNVSIYLEKIQAK